MDVDGMRRELTLEDGRVLETWIDHDPLGTPLLFQYGTPSSGLPFEQHIAAARQRGLRWISWSRPGVGRSTRFEGREFGAAADDARQILDQLGADNAYVMGWSGGGAPALACGARMSDRILGTSTIASLAPFNGEGLDFYAGMGEQNIEAWKEALEGPQKNIEGLEQVWPEFRAMTGADVAKGFGDLVSDVDQPWVTGEFADWLAAGIRHALADSYWGWFDEDMAGIRPWGFDLDTFQAPVHIWHGAHDRFVPFGHGQWLAANINTACPHLLENDGHLTIAVNRFGEILDEMLSPH